MKSQIPGTYSWLGLAAACVIEERDRNVLIRSRQTLRREECGAGGERREERKKARREERKVCAFDTWHLFICAVSQGLKLCACVCVCV